MDESEVSGAADVLTRMLRQSGGGGDGGGNTTPSNASSSRSAESTSLFYDPYTDSQRQLAYVLMQIYFAAISIIAISIICANVLVLIAMYKYSPLQTVTNRFVVSLSLADLLAGSCFIVSLTISTNQGLMSDTTVCAIRAVLPQTALQVSLFNLLGIAIDRYIAVMYPLHYVGVMVGRRANQIILVMWLYAVGLVVIPMIFTHNQVNLTGCYVEFFLNKYHLFVVFLHYWFGAITMIFIYSCIFRTTSAHIRRLERHNSRYLHYHQQISQSKQNGNSDAATTHGQGHNHCQPHISQTVKVFSLVFGTFFLCLTPYYTMYMVVAFNWTPMQMINDFNMSFIYLPLVDVFIALNSTINPYIYAWKYTDFRIAFKNLLCCRSQYQYNMARSTSLYGDRDRDHHHRNSNATTNTCTTLTAPSAGPVTAAAVATAATGSGGETLVNGGTSTGNRPPQLLPTPPAGVCSPRDTGRAGAGAGDVKTENNGNTYALVDMNEQHEHALMSR